MVSWLLLGLCILSSDLSGESGRGVLMPISSNSDHSVPEVISLWGDVWVPASLLRVFLKSSFWKEDRTLDNVEFDNKVQLQVHPTASV